MTDIRLDDVMRGFDDPVLVAESKIPWLTSRLRGLGTTVKATEDKVLAAVEKMGEEFWPRKGDYMERYRPYNVENGVLTIPVTGVLVHDCSYTVRDWVTGYTYIFEAFKRGFSDPEVRGIALDINSGGGQSRGCFDMVERVKILNPGKPIKSILNEEAYSAAYAIATLGDKITAPRMGGAGSIGVYRMHVDYSGALDKAGMRITFVKAGKYKTDGNAYQPLSKSAKADWQERVDAIYDVFVGVVATNRGLPEQKIRNTEARCYLASVALTEGLIDEIASPDVSMQKFVDSVKPQQRNYSMTEKTEKGGSRTYTQEDIDAATAAGVLSGRQQERSRVLSILGAPEAKGRTATALEIALNTDTDPAAAVAVLKTVKVSGDAAEEKPVKEPTAFEKAMANFNPQIGPSGAGQEPGTGEQQKQPGNRFADAYAAMGGEIKKAG